MQGLAAPHPLMSVGDRPNNPLEQGEREREEHGEFQHTHFIAL
jgi:hypothetical protein